MIYVDIVSDTICPWCYIGKRRFERALEQKRPHRRRGRVAPLPAQPRHAGRGHDARRLCPRQVRRRRPAAPDLPGDRRERPRGRHRVPVLAHQAHAQHRAVAPPRPLERQERAAGRGRGRTVQGLFRGRARHRRSRYADRVSRSAPASRKTARAATWPATRAARRSSPPTSTPAASASTACPASS